MSFFPDPTFDMRVMVWGVGIAFVFSVGLFVWLRKLWLSLFVFSVLSNAVLYGNLTYVIANAFNLFGLFHFVRFVWPYLNAGAAVVLALFFLFHKYERAKSR